MTTTTQPTPMPDVVAPAPAGLQERLSDLITAFCGDIRFVYVHIALFAVWIGTRGFGNDHFPFNFLTMAVSLEAIFLSTFILISQNRQQAIAEANNKIVQARQLQLLNSMVADEQLDLKNEALISKLLERMDHQHIRPAVKKIDDLAACVARIEGALESNEGKS